jgi:uncharacterized membrane protein YeiB
MAVGDRIQSLDILRGFALLGMFVVHFHQRSSEPGPARPNHSKPG